MKTETTDMTSYFVWGKPLYKGLTTGTFESTWSTFNTNFFNLFNCEQCLLDHCIEEEGHATDYNYKVTDSGVKKAKHQIK